MNEGILIAGKKKKKTIISIVSLEY